MTIREMLAESYRLLEQRGMQAEDADVLLAACLNCTQEELLIYPDRTLSPAAAERFEGMRADRLSGRSVAVLVGYKEFHGLRFKVTEDTLIPRPETELLVDLAAEHLKKIRSAVVLDIGTGCGTIIVSLAHALANPRNTYYASDVSQNALAVARKNAKLHKQRVYFILSNLFSHIPKKQFHCIVANLPYLTTDQLSEDSIRHEPVGALWGGQHGTELYEEFFRQSLGFVTAGSQILVEMDPQQKSELVHRARAYFPGSQISVHQDLSGRDRALSISI